MSRSMFIKETESIINNNKRQKKKNRPRWVPNI